MEEAYDDLTLELEKRSYVVTMIHGTWGRSSHWYTDNSPLRQRLTAEFGTQVEFRMVKWSGANTHRARTAAIAQLSRTLKLSEDSTTDSYHIVICHSHGGNVALYALRQKEIAARLAGIVCLNTPFVSVLRRNAWPLTAVTSYVAAYLVPKPHCASS
jgi:pimeloyl-ACP methyl ester carboxylesterase